MSTQCFFSTSARPARGVYGCTEEQLTTPHPPLLLPPPVEDLHAVYRWQALRALGQRRQRRSKLVEPLGGVVKGGRGYGWEVRVVPG
jgi:hypothetical protein